MACSGGVCRIGGGGGGGDSGESGGGACKPKRRAACRPKKPSCRPKPKACRPKRASCRPKKKACRPRKPACRPRKPACRPKKRACGGRRKKCSKPGPVTNNGYLNFIRVYRKTHCGLKPNELIIKAARAWCRLNPCKKMHFRRMACKVTKSERHKHRQVCTM